MPYFFDTKINKFFDIVKLYHERCTSDGRDAHDGMIVFGFGRQKGATPLMKETGVTFYMGFLERKITSEKDHKWASDQIKKIIER